MRNALFILSMALLLCVSCGRSALEGECGERADSLLLLLDDCRYRDARRLSLAADELSAMEATVEHRSVAMASQAYSAMMGMDYGRAAALYDSLENFSQCEIERLAGDVGMMMLSYRVSANRAFFDYRARALKRMRRIEEESGLLSVPDRERFVRAKVEFGVVSLCYFSNIGLRDEMLLTRDYLSQDVEACDDVALRLYARMMLASFEPDVLKRAELYATGASIAGNRNYVWLAANYKLLLAISLRNKELQERLLSEESSAMGQLNKNNLSYDEWAAALATEAADGFVRYGDRYMKIEAQAVAASCATMQGDYTRALSILDAAAADVNAFYRTYGTGADTLSLEYFQAPEYEQEEEGLLRSAAMDIPECLLSIRREASCAYAGLGNKELSDVNREAYLYLLRTTRMNKQAESRVQAATVTAGRLYWWSLLAVAAFVFMAVSLYVMGYCRRRRDAVYSSNLKRLLNLSHSLFTSLPGEFADEDAVCSAVCDILDEGFLGFSGRMLFSLSAPFEPRSAYPCVYDFSLPAVGNGHCYTLYVAAEQPLDGEKLSIVEMALPYVSAAIEEGLRIASLLDEQSRLEEQRLAHELYLNEYKRENMLKRVSVSIVNGMRPYMDRLVNELRYLAREKEGVSAERRLQYAAELIEKLKDCNVILERWIKMRRGALNLQIERFSVREVFDIIEKGVPFYAARGIALDVKRSDAVVCADRALTLFMVNTLVDNAGKFTPSGGSIVVDAQEGDGFVELSVTDTGVGLSQEDIDVLLCSKVYDASLIGDAKEPQNRNKGGGFGLMNCRGIIEKYRNTDEVFSVCRMDISSRKGEGSRFSFRLPAGVVRCLFFLLATLFSSSVFCSNTLLERVTLYADSVFLSNVNGDSDAAYRCASQAIKGLNEYYKERVGGVDTLSLTGGASAELLWWRERLFPSELKEDIFFNILDVRNELAVAALATQRWDDYRYNNNIYASLYRLVHEERGLDEYYEDMRQLNNYRQAAVALLFCFIVLMVVTFAMSYVRHRVIGRMNSRIVLALNKRLLAVTMGDEPLSEKRLVDAVLNEIYFSLSEVMCIERLSMMLVHNEKEQYVQAYPNGGVSDAPLIYMRDAYVNDIPLLVGEKHRLALPLTVQVAGEKSLLGAMEFVSTRPLSGNEVLNIELVARYAASVVHHSLVRLGEHYRDLAAAEEATERAKFEEHRLHVQNMVLDNCLSVIKHETIYYPDRIKALASQAMADKDNLPQRSRLVSDMNELMDYYISVFGILSNCATKQLDEVNMCCTQVSLNSEFDSARRFLERKAVKKNLKIGLDVEPTTLSVHCDAGLLRYLLELLLEASLAIEGEGSMLLRAVDGGDSVRVELLDKRLALSKDELALMFVPSRSNITGSDGLKGMEYLVAKEIVRLHDDALLQRGGRLEARSSAEGVIILFTLPKKEIV